VSNVRLKKVKSTIARTRSLFFVWVTGSWQEICFKRRGSCDLWRKREKSC